MEYTEGREAVVSTQSTGCLRSNTVCPDLALTQGRFTRDQVGQQSQVKSSQARGIKTALVTQFPQLETHYDNIFPKKYPVIMAKSSTFRCQFIIVNKEILFVERDRKYFPTLRVLHRCMYLHIELTSSSKIPFSFPRYRWIRVLSNLYWAVQMSCVLV
eukprot:TRINITY_DN1401_c0_g1_i18.p1 TRINITY_DN1401_c0_g1~~TRINITY_DN1401_c0_g1_i18.p1  ORF type:complete len:158 (-),score=12.90 TRINITY_DN1401_c0_g1_i18:308-781(-)